MDQFADALDRQLGIALTYEDITISPTFSLIVHGIVLEQSRAQTVMVEGETINLEPERYFTGERLAMRLAWKPFLDGKAGLVFKGRAYGGTYEGLLAARIQKEVAPFEVRGTWTAVDLAQLAADHPDLQVTMGRCSGTANLLVDQTKQFKYKGPVEIIIDGAQYQPDARYAGDYDLPVFERATADIEMNYEEIRLRDVRCYAPDTSIRLTGMIYQKIPVRNTWLEMDIKLYLTGDPDARANEGYIPLKIKGPVKDPDVLFLGRNLRN